MIASLAQAGQIDEAHAALQRSKEIHPNLSIAWIEEYVPYTAGPMAKFVEGMRKAGFRNNDRTRRLAAILATDVVGYSRLMGEDEAGDGAGGAEPTICVGCEYARGTGPPRPLGYCAHD